MIPLVLAMVVSTSDPQAQNLFDAGLSSLYAYDRAGAAGEFASALQRDPNLAVAAWGEALQESLARLPGDPRALFALALACNHLGDSPCATASNAQFNAIWHGPPPNITDL